MTSRLLDALDTSMAQQSGDSGSLPLSPVNRNISPNPLRLLNEARSKQGRDAFGSPAVNAARDALLLTQSSSRLPRNKNDTGGFNLNYDQETPIKAIDVGGPDQQEKMAEFVTSSFDNKNHGLTVKDGMEKLGLRSKKDFLPGLEVTLLPHQIIGVAWMLEQEKSQYKGGILADDMGLGKTVQMIAVMVMNMPKIDDECSTSLIVVPSALMQQWKEEVETKANGVLSVHVHHGKDKLKKRSQVKDYDVIVTTYQTLNGDFGIPKDVEEEDEAAWLAQHGGVLARVKFFRVIADEAQFIRNRSTRASITMAHVRAKYRWMLTGTPVTNTLADIYGLLRFGRFRPWNDWNDFNAHVAKVQSSDAVLAGERAQAILKPLLLRRTKNSMLEGEPILNLKPKDIELVTLKFSKEEQEVYDSFEKSTKITLNKFIKENSLVKNHTFILVLILRLRQLCCHPNLVLAQTDEFEDPTLLMGDSADKERGRAIKAKGRQWVEQVKERFLKRAKAAEMLDDEGEASCPVCQDLFMENNGRVLGCGHEICFDCLLDLRNSPIAHDGVFGHGDERENAAIEKKFEEAEAKGWRPCPTCHEMLDLSQNKVFLASAFAPSAEQLAKINNPKRKFTKRSKLSAAAIEISDSDSDEDKPKTFEERGLDDSDDDMPDIADILRPAKRQKKTRIDSDDSDDGMDVSMDELSRRTDPSASATSKKDKGKGKGKKGPVGSEGISDAVRSTWSRGDDDMEPSVKMLKLIQLLKEWKVYEDKTICYSQWTSMLDLIERLFSRYGIRSLRFDGRMDKASRDATLAKFKMNGGPKVILISTKSGGVGLNLVAANRIINMDLSWNYASESQAYDRAHRIGQSKTVFVKRLVVANTIEERMLKLQEVKVGLAEAALGEGSGTKLHKLSVKDIKFLFGMTPPAKGKANANANRQANSSDAEDSD